MTTCPCGLPVPGSYISSAKCHDYGEPCASEFSLPTDFSRVSSGETEATLSSTRSLLTVAVLLSHRWITDRLSLLFN